MGAARFSITILGLALLGAAASAQSKISAVTAADVQRVARKYIPLDDIAIVAVGDAAKIRSVLAEFGTIEDWDAEGRRVR